MSNQPPVLRFHCFSLSLSIIRSLRPLLVSIKRCDASLVKQLRTAASSVSLNLAESRGRRGKDAVHFQRIALGSAEETTACLLVADSPRLVRPADMRGSRPHCQQRRARDRDGRDPFAFDPRTS